MKDRQLIAYRTYFLLGLTIAFVSLFMEWYVFQGVDSTKVIVIDWSYHLLLDWYSPSKLTTELNSCYKPQNASVPLPLVIFFIGVLIIASFGALFYSPERFNKIKNPKGFAFINVAVIILLIYFIVVAPIIYLFPNQLLFPSLQLYNSELELLYSFSVGIGYWSQLLAFMCCFPYTCLYYKIASTFELECSANLESPPSPSFNLDKLIAEMELELSPSQNPMNRCNETINTFKTLETEALQNGYESRYLKEDKFK